MNNIKSNKMFENLELNIDEKNNNIEKFMQIFSQYSEKLNLVSKNDIKLLLEKHIYDSLSYNLFRKKYNIENEKLIDIGTGGGFPALPLAIVFDDINIVAVDSIQKKIKAVEGIVNELNLENIQPLCKRVEELEFNYKFDVAISRAMAELRIILEYAIPQIRTNGYFVAYKSIKADEEILGAKNALKILNAEIVDKIEYSLPIEQENKRVLVIIQKKAPTPLIYPRKNGIISKKPL